jgi:thiol:disulfide interchange protein DsbC
MSLAILCPSLYAQTSDCGTASDYAWLTEALQAQQDTPETTPSVVRIQPLDQFGLCELKLNSGTVLYTQPDSRNVILGRVYEVKAHTISDLTQKRADEDTRELLGGVESSDYIAFSPSSPARASIYVMTDVDCQFCRKLHHEVPALNEAGVEVRYLPYVRGGKQGTAWNAMSNAWCAEDRQAAFSKAIDGTDLPAGTCDSKTLEHYQSFARAVQLQGTPHIIMANGQTISGYRPAAELIELALASSAKE